ncbi:MAG TPA: PAS domain S-box protein, partial [Pyrinomonadaceae bacterium]|nr:PAS domain S-box protein [Pyrinomonadaceae bacterium]
MTPDTLQHYRELSDRLEAEKRLDTSVEQLEALAALAAADGPRAVEMAFACLADTISSLTDYRTCLVSLFTDETPHHPRVLSYSSNVTPEYAEVFASGTFPREEVTHLIVSGVRIEVGELGFASYFPPSHYHVLDRVFPERYKADVERFAPADRGAARWHDGDELIVPLVTRAGEYIGIISLDDPRSGRAPDRQSVLPVVAFARQAAQLIERQQDADALAQQVEREALINRITLAVRRSLDPAEVFRTAVEEMGVHMGADRCTLFVVDKEANVVRNVAEYDADGMEPIGGVYEVPLVAELIKMITRHGVLAFDDVATDARIRPVYESILQKIGVRSIMYAAIHVGEEMRGAFTISTVRESRRWRDADVVLARAVADQTGIAIRQAELFEMVARGKQTWEATFDAMSDGVFIFGNDRRLIRVNRAGATMEGESPRALLGLGCCQILSAGERLTGGPCVIERVIAAGRGVTLEYTPERLGRPVLVNAEPVHVGGRAVGTVCTVRDLSELRHVEALARERQSLLENVLESAREAIYACDLQGRFQWCNRGLATMTGYRVDEVIGRHFFLLAHDADRDKVLEYSARALRGESQSYEMRYVTREGQVRYALIDNAPLVIEGRVTGVLGIARDITEQKQELERAEQADKLRALGQLASGVAHDFNNALAAILGRAQLLRRLTRDEEVAHGLDVIQTAAEDAAATVRRIRSFARQTPGEEFSSVDVGELLRDAAEITRTRWENDALARGLRYDVRVESAPGCHAEGTASELREVFVNMIVNAVDAMPEGGRLSMTCGCEVDGEGLFVTFEDTGTGMTDEVRRRIFEPFYTTKGLQGTGLGLFVSYGIIERHRGRIEVTSEPGRGSTFRIRLPRAVAAESARAAD